MSDREPSPTSASVPPPQQIPETMDMEVLVKEESPCPPSPTAKAAPNSEASSSPSRQRRMTVAQRRAALRDDPQSGEVEPHRVYCRTCGKWIRLSTAIEYSLSNWRSHRTRCDTRSVGRTPSKRSFSPSSRVATAERKIVLLNDPQVKAFSPGHIQCGTCKTEVALEGEVDYDLTKWVEHKENCIPKTPAPITPQGSRPRVFPPTSSSSTHSQISAVGSARSPTPVGEGSSSHSTETTAVTESSPAAVRTGVKRAREEEAADDEEAAKDERPTNRPRKEAYKPPEKDAPSVFGWLTLPLKEFARGFREGLGTT